MEALVFFSILAVIGLTWYVLTGGGGPLARPINWLKKLLGR